MSNPTTNEPKASEPKFNDPKTTRPCPKQQADQTDEAYRAEVLDWVKENTNGWEVLEEVGGGGKEVSTTEVNKTACWEWEGAFAPHSGGARYNNFAAHSFIYRGLVGEYEGSLLRVCRNKNCVNPDHAYVAVGARTRRKQEIKKIINDGGLVLKEDGRREVVNGIKEGVTKEIERVVTEEVKRMERDIVEGVVAKLIEIRFDEMVAKAVRGGK